MGERAKTFKLRGDQLRELVAPMGGCLASDRITVDGEPVGSMLREPTNRPDDSGWVFLAGDESQAYLDDPDRLALYEVNTIANYDPAIIPLLYALPGQRFERDASGGDFVEAPDSRGDLAASHLPPGVDVVQGILPLQHGWVVRLTGPFRRRLEDGDLVLWRPCLTLWLCQLSDGSKSPDEVLEGWLSRVPAQAFQVERRGTGELRRLSYRFLEAGTDAGVPSLFHFAVAPGHHLMVAAHGDREEDIDAARLLIESIAQARGGP